MAIRTVNPGGGADYTSVATAVAACSDGDTVRLVADYNTSFDNNINTQVNFDSDTGTRKWTGGAFASTYCIRTQSPIAKALNISSIIFDSSGAGTGTHIIMLSHTSGMSLNFSQCTFQWTGTGTVAQFIRLQTATNSASALTISRCLFIGGTLCEYGLYFDTFTTTKSVTIYNSIFRDFTDAIGTCIFQDSVVGSAVIDVAFCMFDNCTTAINTLSDFKVRNCDFFADTTDIVIDGDFSGTDVTYCAFDGSNPGGLGTGNIFSIATSVFTNYSGNDFTPVLGSAINNAGIAITGITTDYNGNSRNVGSAPDISPIEQQSPNVGVPLLERKFLRGIKNGILRGVSNG